jgi:hypothetical protein
MKRENEARKKETDDLRNLLESQKQLLDTANRNLGLEIEEREAEILRKDREILRIKQEILAQKEKAAADFDNFMRLDQMVSSIKINLTASVYFNAIRNEPYLVNKFAKSCRENLLQVFTPQIKFVKPVHLSE